MRYVGGKARIAKWIRDHVLAVADEYRGVALTYVEPFVGSGASGSGITSSPSLTSTAEYR